jgi:hypothetical protein
LFNAGQKYWAFYMKTKVQFIDAGENNQYKSALSSDVVAAC